MSPTFGGVWVWDCDSGLSRESIERSLHFNSSSKWSLKALGATVGMCCLKPRSTCKPGGTNSGLTEFHISIVLLLMFSLLLITSLNPTKDRFSHKILFWHIHSMILTCQWQQGNKPGDETVQSIAPLPVLCVSFPTEHIQHYTLDH